MKWELIVGANRIKPVITGDEFKDDIENHRILRVEVKTKKMADNLLLWLKTFLLGDREWKCGSNRNGESHIRYSGQDDDWKYYILVEENADDMFSLLGTCNLIDDSNPLENVDIENV